MVGQVYINDMLINSIAIVNRHSEYEKSSAIRI